MAAHKYSAIYCRHPTAVWLRCVIDSDRLCSTAHDKYPPFWTPMVALRRAGCRPLIWSFCVPATRRCRRPHIPTKTSVTSGTSAWAARACRHPGGSSPASSAPGSRSCRKARRQFVRLLGLLVAERDFVGLGDAACPDGPQSLPQALAGLPQQFEGVAGWTLRGGALRISSVFLDEVSLECCRDFVSRLQRVVNGPVPRSVVNHAASIASAASTSGSGGHIGYVRTLHARRWSRRCPAALRGKPPRTIWAPRLRRRPRATSREVSLRQATASPRTWT